MIDGPKNFKLSYLYGAVSAISLGGSLFFSADLGTRHDGLIGPASFWPGCLGTYLFYHLKEWIFWVSGKTPDPLPGEPWFSRKRSMYFELFFVENDQENSVKEGGDSEKKKDEEKSADLNEIEEQKTYLGFSHLRFLSCIYRGIIETLINVSVVYSF